MKAVILAAGMSTRLGSLLPKPLTPLKNEKTIMDYQIENLTKYIPIDDICVVVGHKFYAIVEKFPELAFVYNNRFVHTNTSKSLLLALKKFNHEDTIWINGDVYFDHEILNLLIKNGHSCCAVDNKKCAEEEIKYTLNKQGNIQELSKQVKKPVGEALGINMIKGKDIETFRKALSKVKDQDYFEKALENLTREKRLVLKPVDTNGYFCQEIDFPEDLESVRIHINKHK